MVGGRDNFKLVEALGCDENDSAVAAMNSLFGPPLLETEKTLVVVEIDMNTEIPVDVEGYAAVVFETRDCDLLNTSKHNAAPLEANTKTEE